ncbi:MAG: response regulator [Chloroflexota bacterium]
MAQKKVLVVDDEVSVTELFSMMLEMEGYAAQVVHNVKDAIQVLERDSPDLILLDIMMPVASGLELCRHVRSTPALASIPIIILSAKSQLEEVKEGLEAGANLYLLKPVSKNELVEAVRKTITS